MTEPGRVLTPQEAVILDVMAKMKQALERLPAERAAIKAAPLREQQYRTGLCDGMEETISALSECFRPLATTGSADV